MNESVIINLPKILDNRGNLSFFENGNQIPFEIKRVHWIFDVPGGEERGGLAYKDTEEFVVAASGSFDVVLDDGFNRQTIQLNRSLPHNNERSRTLSGWFRLGGSLNSLTGFNRNLTGKPLGKFFH